MLFYSYNLLTVYLLFTTCSWNVGCWCKYHPHTSCGPLLFSHRILLLSLMKSCHTSLIKNQLSAPDFQAVCNLGSMAYSSHQYSPRHLCWKLAIAEMLHAAQYQSTSKLDCVCCWLPLAPQYHLHLDVQYPKSSRSRLWLSTKLLSNSRVSTYFVVIVT